MFPGLMAFTNRQTGLRNESDDNCFLANPFISGKLGFQLRLLQQALKFKADRQQAILKYARKYSQLQVILGGPQPRVSELLNGKIANKSVGKLLYYAGRLGIEAKARFSKPTKQSFAESWPRSRASF